jgi:hypothetical protein
VLAERRRKFFVTRGGGLLCLLREHRKRRFQSVREISRGGERSGDRLLTIFEQRIEIIHERLHFIRIIAFDCPAASLAHRRETGAKTSKRRHGFLNEEHPAGDERYRQDDHRHVRPVAHRKLGMVARQLDDESNDHDHHRDHPDECSDEQAGTERALHDSVPMR